MPETETWWCRTARDVAVVRGPDAEAYLQSQVSQDLAGLDAGASRWALLLAPDGKVDLLGRVVRTGDDVFVLDTDAGWGEALGARLRRFLIRTKAEVETGTWSCLAVRGPAAATAAVATAFAVPAWWASPAAVDVLGQDLAPPPDLPEADAARLEAARIAAGWPAMGREIRPGESIPAETGVVDVAVSFTKGCYPGQELVERMHARGAQPPRYVRRLLAERPIAAGAEVVHDGRPVGTVTSAAGQVALAVIARAVLPGATVDAGGVPASVHELRPD